MPGVPRVTKGWCAVLSLAVLAGCSNSLNTNCGWDPEPSRQLNLSTPTDARHLHQVVELAEELSIRFGDERWAPGQSRAQGREEQCFTPLLQQVADRRSR